MLLAANPIEHGRHSTSDVKAAQSRSGSPSLRSSGSSDGEGDGVPDADLIARAKAKRLQLRRAHIAPGYIPSESAEFRRVKDFKRTEDALKTGSGSEGSESDEPEDDLRLKFGPSGEFLNALQTALILPMKHPSVGERLSQPQASSNCSFCSSCHAVGTPAKHHVSKRA
jgi:hypothetical protein